MMNRFISISACFFILIGATSDLIAQPPTNPKMSSTEKPAKSIHELERFEPSKAEKPKPQALPKSANPPVMLSENATYLHPGILVNIGNRWEGSDHLLNISNQIGVYVTIIKPEGEVLNINERELKSEVEKIFSLSNIKPESLVTAGKPPLPAFQINIFVYPIDKGYVAFCGGRLFESVVLERFKMDSNMAFQAITWEKEHLIVSPKDQFPDQLKSVVQDIARTFQERYQVYEKIKNSY